MYCNDALLRSAERVSMDECPGLARSRSALRNVGMPSLYVACSADLKDVELLLSNLNPAACEHGHSRAYLVYIVLPSRH